MIIKKIIYHATLVLISFHFIACEEFITVDAPNNKLIRSEVFKSDETAQSAMRGIYNELYMAAFSNGSRSSVSVLCGLSADNLQSLSTSNIPRMQFQENEITPDNQNNFELWQGAYHIIYLTNSFLEGLYTAEGLSAEIANRLEGEARFIRAFAYFYLVNLYGDVPLILTSNYRDNELASRTEETIIHDQIISDLKEARELLSATYSDGEKTQVNQYAATALLARMYLYLEDWSNAERLSNEVIEADTYEILENLEEIFLANSTEAIWQISPLGDGEMTTHTWDGAIQNIDPDLWFFATVKLSEGLIEVFEPGDKRLQEWIGYNESLEVYFAKKYKVINSSDFPIKEYSTVLRLPEQYLIRAEARIHQGNLNGAMADINVIRKRAGLELLSSNTVDIKADALMNIVLEERRKEFFTEWGHRWLDLKRTRRSEAILSPGNPSWENTDVLYPIPQQERIKNPNLSQNPGY